MNHTLQTTIDTIVALVEKIIPLSAERFNGTAEEIIRRSPLQIGVMDELEINYNAKGVIRVDTTNLSLTETHCLPSEFLTQEQVEQDLLPLLKAQLLPIIKSYDHSPILNFKFIVDFSVFALLANGVVRKLDYRLFDYTAEDKKNQLLDAINTYIENRLVQGKHPTKELDTHFLSQHLVDPKLYPSLQAKSVIETIHLIFERNKHIPKLIESHRRTIIYALEQWANNEFLPKYCTTKEEEDGRLFSLSKRIQLFGLKTNVVIEPHDKPLLELLVFTALLIIKYSPNYSRSTGIEFLNYAEGLGYLKAKEIRQLGSGAFTKEESLLKETGVECTANDVFAIFTVKIKVENAESYKKALDFMCGLLLKGFPKSYRIKYSSKVKTALPIKGIKKTATQQFFVDAMAYATLWPTIAAYAQLAMVEFEWYEDAEDEHCAMPGTYAALGLALKDERYFPLVSQYFSTLDEEHQSVHSHFIHPFIAQWGVTKTTIPVLIDCFYVSQEKKIPKLGEAFEEVDLLLFFLAYTQTMEAYQFSLIVYFIWGKVADLEKRIKKADKTIKPLLMAVLHKLEA